MPQNISIRVPWHDHGWDGTVCTDPQGNNSCLRLRNISENRNDNAEAEICGQQMADFAETLSCIGEGACFMSPTEIVRTAIHPYKKSNPNTHGHFLPTDLIYPAYSLPGRPFAWTMRKNIEIWKDIYNIDYQPKREPNLKFDTICVQDAENQKAIFDFFTGMLLRMNLCVSPMPSKFPSRTIRGEW